MTELQDAAQHTWRSPVDETLLSPQRIRPRISLVPGADVYSRTRASNRPSSSCRAGITTRRRSCVSGIGHPWPQWVLATLAPVWGVGLWGWLESHTSLGVPQEVLKRSSSFRKKKKKIYHSFVCVNPVVLRICEML